MKRGREGQALVLVTISMTVLLGMLALVVDLGWSYYRRQLAQTAAEAAAMAAAYTAQLAGSSVTCGSNNVVCQVPTACSASPTAPPGNNLIAGCLYAKANGFLNTGSQTVSISANTTTSIPGAPGVTTALYWVTVTITETNSQLFSEMLGKPIGKVAAEATAAIIQGTSPSCIYVLSSNASSALFLSGSNSSLYTSCNVYVNSSSSSSIVVNGQARLDAHSFTVGGVGSCQINGDCFFPSGVPATNQTAAADPYASLPAPAYSGCGGSSAVLNLNQGNTTLNPGVYCGGINVSGNAQVTFNAGTYILNGGGLQVNSSNSSISGTGVFFYNTANGYNYGPILITGMPSVSLSAPTSGTYSGVLFYQDRNITSNSNNQINGKSDPGLVGSLYFPTTPLLLTGGTTNTPFLGKVIARTLNVNGGSNLYVSISGPATCCASSKTTVLIE